MPKGRTPRPHHKDITVTETAQKLAKVVERRRFQTKDELREAYSRVINPDGLSEAQIAKKADKAMAKITKVHDQIEEENGGFQFYLVRPRATSDVI
jgi:transposase